MKKYIYDMEDELLDVYEVIDKMNENGDLDIPFIEYVNDNYTAWEILNQHNSNNYLMEDIWDEFYSSIVEEIQAGKWYPYITEIEVNDEEEN